MSQYVDYSKLPRRELQALCKQHKIQANKTNVFMADALDALLNNAPRQQEEFQEEEIPAPDSPEVEKVVEKVKGKRAPKKALLAEPELDSLAGLLASSTINCNVHEETTEPETTPEEPVPMEDKLPLLPPVVPATKGLRGRPRITMKVEVAVEAEASEVDDNMLIAGANVSPPIAPVTEVVEETTMEEAEWPKTWAEAAMAASPLPVEADQAQVEPEADEFPTAYIRTKNLARQQKTPSKAVEVEPEAVEEVKPELTSVSAEPEPEPEREDVVSGPIMVETEKTSPPKEMKAKKTKKGKSKSRRNAEVEIEAEAVADIPEPEAMVEDQVFPEAASFLDEEVTEESKDVGAELEDNMSSLKPRSFTISPSVLKEKPKARKSKKPSAKPRKNVEVPTVEDVCESTNEEPVVVEKQIATAPYVLEEENIKVQKQVQLAEEPVTPKKVVTKTIDEDKEKENALLSLSMRKLVKVCKEKGLRTRGANTRSIKL